MAALHWKLHYSEVCYNEIELYPFEHVNANQVNLDKLMQCEHTLYNNWAAPWENQQSA